MKSYCFCYQSKKEVVDYKRVVDIYIYNQHFLITCSITDLPSRI